MYHQAQQDPALPSHSTMFVESQRVADQRQQDNPAAAHPHNQRPQSHSLAFSPQNSTGMPNQDGNSNLQVQPEGVGVDTQNPSAGKASLSGPRPSQNRAPFGKWKSKMISGFPAADVPLPPGITAKEICKSFPNHLDDHLILALMRQGKGAKAIDAMIPAQPGKQKAGQSHSKIQLRISTIREAFPNENFPITSTKRNRARSEVLKDETMSSEDEHASCMTANRALNSKHATARDPSKAILYTAKTQYEDKGGFLKKSRRNSPVRSGYDGTRERPPLRFEAAGPASSFTPELPQAARSLRQIPLLELQIREEYQKHKQLVFNFYYSDQPLSRPEMEQTILAHCADMYDSISRELQANSGVASEKTVLPNGVLEHSLSYLRRSIKNCFERLPEYRARFNLDCSEEQTVDHVEIAVLQDLLARLHEWTRYLERKLQIAGQTRAHKNLHTTTNSGTTSIDAEITPPPILGRNPGRSSEPELCLPNLLRPGIGSTASGISSPIDMPDNPDRYAANVSFITTASSGMNMEPSSPVPGNFRKTHQSRSSTSTNYLQENKFKVSNQRSEHLSAQQGLKQQENQEADNLNEGARPSRLGPVLEPEDEMMMDAPMTTADNPRRSFEDYMEEAGRFVNAEARATDLPQLPGKQQTKSLFEINCLSFAHIISRD